MPELPEVETIRRGLAAHVIGASVRDVEVLRERSVRRHDGGPPGFEAALRGQRLRDVRRRGKFLWLPLAGEAALLAHLGMSGQLLVGAANAATHPHLRVRLHLADSDTQVLDFVDQRTFGHLLVADLVTAPDGRKVPAPMVHIAPDLLEPNLDRQELAAAIGRRNSGIKRVLLDQRVVSGIGNIYADEALWRAKVHHEHPASDLPAARIHRVLDAAQAVMVEAIAAGGTSFDALYVDVAGQSGYFARELAVYGREGEPCLRCGAAIRRVAFANRSAHLCPSCQPNRPHHRNSTSVTTTV